MASLLAQRLNLNVPTTGTVSHEVMYTADGAAFQERCLAKCATKSDAAIIGSLVTAINNNRITVAEAERRFNDSLWAGRN